MVYAQLEHHGVLVRPGSVSDISLIPRQPNENKSQDIESDGAASIL